jgi:hypothetical protein
MIEQVIHGALLAQAVPTPDDSLAGVIDFLVKAFQGGDWFAVGAVVVMLSVWASGKFVTDAKWLPLISAGYGMVYSLVLSISSSKGAPWYAALYQGLITSGGAALFWSTLGKRFLPSLIKDAEPEADVKDTSKGG